MKLLAATSKERVAHLKDMPTVAESGYPEVVSLAWNGLFAPAGTPTAVIDEINADVIAALNEPSVREALLQQGLVPGGQSPAEFKTLIEQETGRWARIIRKAEIKLD